MILDSRQALHGLRGFYLLGTFGKREPGRLHTAEQPSIGSSIGPGESWRLHHFFHLGQNLLVPLPHLAHLCVELGEWIEVVPRIGPRQWEAARNTRAAEPGRANIGQLF